MLFALYGILLLGGIYVVGIAFSLPAFQGLVFIAGILLVAAAVSVPFVAGAFEQRK
jgi:hypothetical protein